MLLRRIALLAGRLALAVLALCAVAATTGLARPISPYLVANNLWYATPSNAAGSPSASVMTLAGQAGIRLIRIGGANFDGGMPSNAALLTWVDRIRAIGAEPVIQVSQYRSAAEAASAVTHLNLTHGRNVRYWSIGNEPWLQRGQTTPVDEIAAIIETYFKERAAAMKAVDPSIKIFGVDSEDFQSSLHSRLFGGANNIAGRVPGQTYYYCDGLSWHRYPQSDASVLRPEREGLTDIRDRIQNCETFVANVNASQGRTGADALIWSIGEFNGKNGTAVHTFGAGQMFAGVYGLAMRHGADYAAAWSLREGAENNRGPQDFSLLDTEGLIPRSTYWHTQLVSRHFSGRYLEGAPSIASSTSDILVYGAEDAGLGRVSVMILNRGATAQPYTLHLNSTATFTAPGAIALNVDAARPDTHSDTLAPQSTHVLVFTRDALTRIAYARTDFEAATPVAPQSTVLPRPAAFGVLDDFSAYTDFAAQGYWSGLHLNGGTASVADQRLVLRTTGAAFSTASIASPLAPAYNFFQRGFTVGLSGLALASTGVASADTQFRLSLNSSRLRSFRADDSLALRITPGELRLGYKLNQPDVQGELRAGASSAAASLAVIPLPGTLHAVLLSLDPDAAGPVAGVSTIHYTLQLDGAFGRLVRTGSFTASAADWGATGDSSLVLEARRENASTGAPGDQVEFRADAVTLLPRVLDDFSGYASLAGQTYWQSLFVGGNSTTAVSAGVATLQARADAFASAALAGPVSPAFNFFDRAFTVELRDLALSSSGLTAEESVFRLSLCSSSARSFTAPDALTLRINPDRIVLGVKLDQASADAEFRTGAATTAASLLDFNPGGTVTGVALTLAPVGSATASAPATIFYALRLTGSFGELTRTGAFTAERSRWGATGDAALVLEARRNRGVAATTASLMRANLGAIAYTSLPDDRFSVAPRFESWLLRAYPADALADAATRDALAVPAGDGIPNLLRYAFGLPVTVSSASSDLLPGLIATPSETSPLFIHQERAGAADLTYTVEASAELAAWSLPVTEHSRSAPDAEGWITVATRAEAPAGAPRVFFRVRVSKN
ncbi:MAG: hypothetical protein MUE42_08495 [Opitutaceae bacterium]|jgi:hypothetical protein|nr:hypothetical protein [Opitutaceae bacterium]